MREMRLDDDLIQFVLRCLTIWTSNTWTSLSPVIYHEHGIPQGPMSSGMLSELVLQHLDKAFDKQKQAYVRYVDDIKLFARTEVLLRQKLIRLDFAAKEVALFPQSSKINIRHVKDANSEIKTISIHQEATLFPVVNQIGLSRRIKELSKRGRILSQDITKFKFLLAVAQPTGRLNLHLIAVLKNHPEHFRSISYYFSRYARLPKVTARMLLDGLIGNDHYHAVNGAILESVIGNVVGKERAEYAAYAYERLMLRRNALPLQPTFKSALIKWCLIETKLSYAEYKRVLDDEKDWWVKCVIITWCGLANFGPASFEVILNDAVRSPENDVARIAAEKIILEGQNLHKPHNLINHTARMPLVVAGKMLSHGKLPSIIPDVLYYIIKSPLPPYDWNKLLDPNHTQAQLLSISCKQSFETDIDALVVRLDSLMDIIFKAACDRVIPGIKYSYGGHFKSPPRLLVPILPKCLSGFQMLHELRLKSFTAHPRSQAGAITKRLKHYDFYKIRQQVYDALLEVIANVVP